MPERELTRSVWGIDADEYPASAPIEDRARFLLRYAILAPSSHNSQPWRFRVLGSGIEVAADGRRRLDAADPDRRELYVSVGCAVENLRIAAERFGFAPRVEYPDRIGADGVATVAFRGDGDPSNGRRSDLFDAITERRTSHGPFEDRPLDPAVRDDLAATVTGAVGSQFVDDPAPKRAIGELQAEADRLLMDDPAYRRELGHWIGNGALGSAWLAARIGQAVVTHLDLGGREAAKNSRLVDRAPLVAVLTTDSDDPEARVEVGRVFERLALTATAAGVAVHPMSQTLERPGLRTRLVDLLGEDAGKPQHLFRLGYTDETAAHTPRWPIETFLADR